MNRLRRWLFRRRLVREAVRTFWDETTEVWVEGFRR